MTERIGRYVIEETGEDGVMRARDPSLDRVVSLTVLGPEASPEARARFERHARAAAAIDHPNVVRVLETGQHEETLFVATELFSGRTLALAAQHDEAADCERWLFEIAKALEALHEAGIVHRAVTAENVRISSSGIAKLGGFTAARASVAGPASFRTRTMTSIEDTDAGDRASWGSMALSVLEKSKRSSRTRSIARRAVDGDFASTKELVTALGGRPRQSAKKLDAIFIGAVAGTVLVVSIAASIYALRRRPAEIVPLEASVPVVVAPITSTVPDVDAPPPVVADAKAPVLPAIGAHPWVQVVIGPYACFRDDQRVEIERMYQAAAGRLAACIRHRQDGTPVTAAAVDIQVGPDGGQHRSVLSTILQERDQVCLYDELDKAWHSVSPQCAKAEVFEVQIYRGCDCSMKPGQPRCADCTPAPSQQ